MMKSLYSKISEHARLITDFINKYMNTPACSIAIRLIFLCLTVFTSFYIDNSFVHLLIYLLIAIYLSTILCLIATSVTVLYYLLFINFYYLDNFLLYTLIIMTILSLFLHSSKNKLEDYQYYPAFFTPIIRYFYYITTLIIIFLCTLDSTDLYPLILMLVALTLLQISEKNLRLKKPSRSTIYSIALLLMSCIFSLIFLETGARIIFGAPDKNSGLYMPHHEYIFLLNPGGKATYTIALSADTNFPVTYNISQQGFRDRYHPPKSIDEKRILLLGDSFTMGHAVEAQHTIAQYLENIFDSINHDETVTVINGGMNAAGPLQAYGMFLERGLQLEPDVIILQLFLFNDIDDVLMTIGKAQRSFYAPMRTIINTLRQQSEFPYWLEYNARQYSRTYVELSKFTGGQPIIGDNLAALRFFPLAQPLLQVPSEPNLSPILDINRKEWYPELNEGLDLLLHYVQSIHQICNNNGIQFYVYFIPDMHEVSDKLWSDVQRRIDTDETFKPLHAIKIVQQELDSLGIASFSLGDVLTNHELPVEELYFIHDGHLTPVGNEIAAEVIYENIKHCLPL